MDELADGVDVVHFDGQFIVVEAVMVRSICASTNGSNPRSTSVARSISTERSRRWGSRTFTAFMEVALSDPPSLPQMPS
jgi:hypothetical protein